MGTYRAKANVRGLRYGEIVEISDEDLPHYARWVEPFEQFRLVRPAQPAAPGRAGAEAPAAAEVKPAPTPPRPGADPGPGPEPEPVDEYGDGDTAVPVEPVEADAAGEE